MIAFNVLLKGWPCIRQSGKHLRDPTHDYSTARVRPHSNLRGFQESLHTFKVSAELLGIVLVTTVATTLAVSSNQTVISWGRRAKGEVIEYSKTAKE